MPPNGKFSFTLDSSLRDVLHKLLLAGLSFLKLRGGRCPICNSLDPKGHKRTQTDSDGTLSLWLNSEFAELLKGEKHECNFCALVHEILDRLSPAFLPPGTTYKHLLITFKLEAGLTVVEFEEPTSRTKFCFQIYNATGESHFGAFLFLLFLSASLHQLLDKINKHRNFNPVLASTSDEKSPFHSSWLPPMFAIC